METFRAIRSRRSVRVYKPTPVPEDLIEDLVTAGVWAPSASNRQELVFIAITAPHDMLQLRPFAPGMFGNPPVAIVIACDRSRLPDTPAGNQISDVVLMDAAMAAQNILLAATDKNIGSCVIHSFRPNAVQRFLGLPEHVVPILLVAIGYKARPPLMTTRRPLKDVLFWGRKSYNKKAKNGESKNKQHTRTKSSTNKSLPQTSNGGFSLCDSTLLVICVLSSTRGLLEEPLRYGPMRLLDTLCRLIEFLDRHGLAEKKVKHIFKRLVRFKEKGFAAYPNLSDELDSALAELSAGP